MSDGSSSSDDEEFEEFASQLERQIDGPTTISGVPIPATIPLQPIFDFVRPGSGYGSVCRQWRAIDVERARTTFHRNLLKALLKAQGSSLTEQCKSSSVAIEAAVFDLLQGRVTSKSYGVRLRQLIANLSRNSTLRNDVLTGRIQAAALVKMRSRDLASAALKQRSATFRG